MVPELEWYGVGSLAKFEEQTRIGLEFEQRVAGIVSEDDTPVSRTNILLITDEHISGQTIR